MKPVSGLSEGELLQTLLESCTPEQAFMIGEVMGIMAKGDQVRIAELEHQNRELKRELDLIRSLDRVADEMERNEQDGKG